MKAIMSFKAIALALPLFAMSSSAFAQELEKNGLPCISEICIGDGLSELAKIKWQQAQQPYKINSKPVLTAERKLSEVEARLLEAGYPNAGTAAPYLLDRQFDEVALTALSRVKAACEVNELFGHFGADTGAPTKVGVSLAPSKSDPAKQVWTVTTIVREFPSALSNEDRSLINAQLVQRYVKYGAGNRVIQSSKPFEGRFIPGGASRFGFGLTMVRPADEGALMKQNPACAAGK